MVRRIVFLVLMIAAFAGVSYYGYLQYVKIKGPRVTALEAIGEEVVFFVRTDDVRAALYKMTKETNFWPELARNTWFHQIEKQFLAIDSLLSRHSQLNEIVELNPFMLSLQRVSGNNYSFLHIFELPPGETAPLLEDFIRTAYGKQSIVLKKEHQQAEIVTVNLTGPEALYYFSVYKGLYIGSFSELLVQQSIAQIRTRKSWTRDESFARVHSTAGKNVDGNLYIHLPNFYSWIRQTVQAERSPFDGWKTVGYWLEFDVLFQSDALLLSGYTITPDSANSLLDGYRFSPSRVNIPEILPQGVRWMVHKALSADPGNFPGTDKHKNLLPWLGTQAASVYVKGPGTTGDTLVVIHAGDAVEAVLSLQKMQRDAAAGRQAPEEEVYLDYPVRGVLPGTLFRELFGDHFPVYRTGFYIVLKDYVVFSRYKESLKNVIDQFYEQKTLVEFGDYPSFSDNLSDQANIYFYSQFDPLSASILPGPVLEVDPGLTHFLAGIDAAALQFSYFNRMFYTNAYLQFQQETELHVQTDWNLILDADVAGKPSLVPNHRSGKQSLLVTDERNTLYLVDHVGRIQWHMPLVEKPVSEYYPVDFYGNGKIQYLFNTENYVYLVDLNGNYVADFPKKFRTPASGPLTVFDYDSKRDYRLVVPLRDDKLYNFDKNLDPVTGWQTVKAPGTVQTAVQHLIWGGRDYLIGTDSTGSVVVFNRTGNERIPGPLRIRKAKNSDFYLNRTNTKGEFLTTDKEGTLLYISEKGKTNTTDFGTFSPEHRFFYTDFDGDDHHDFLFVDRDSLVVYNRFKNVILSRKMDGNEIRYAQVFRGGGKTFLAVQIMPAGEIRIYDREGEPFGDPYPGSVPFVITGLEDGHLYLFTGQGRQVLKYRLN